MTLPASGTITMAQVAAELGISATGLSLNDSRVRALAGKPSGVISFSDLHGKSAITPFTISGFSPSSPGYLLRFGAGVQSRSIQVVLANGSGSFSYSWSVISNNAGGSLSNASSQTCTFTTGSISPYDYRTTVLRVTVTDNGDGGRQQTADFTQNWEWEF